MRGIVTVFLILLGSLLPLIGEVSTKSQVYEEVYSTLTSFPHRLPGSDAFLKSQAVVEKHLKAAGLKVLHQEYETQVPVTRRCDFLVNGVRVEGVAPYGPSMSTLPNTGGKPLVGPLVYAGSGDLESIRHLDLKGAIVLLDMSSVHMRLSFIHGAKAVVFVGDDEATQWNVAHHFSKIPMNIPRAYVPREVAQKQGWINSVGEVANEASLDLLVTWESRQVSNLCAVIKGKEGASFNLNSEEGLVLSTRLDTFGAIPDLSPQKRDAANAALLTEVATQLAATQPTRSIFIVFSGSEYNVHEGLRYFYDAYARTWNLNREKDTLEVRKGYHEEEVEELSQQLELLTAEDFFAKSDHAQFQEVIQQIKRNLRAMISGYNFELMELSVKGRALPRENKAEREEHQKKVDQLSGEKKIWNDIQRQVSEGKLSVGYAGPDKVADGERDNVDYFNELKQELIEGTTRGLHHAKQRLRYVEGSMILEKHMKGVTFVSHFTFDFANAVRPWCFDSMGNYRFLMDRDISFGLFAKSLKGMVEVYEKHEGAFGKGKLLKASTKGFMTPGFLSTPRPRRLSGMVASSHRVNGFNLVSVGEPLDSDGLPVEEDVDLSALASPLQSYLLDLSSSPAISLASALPENIFNRPLRYSRVNGRPDGRGFQFLQKGSDDIEGSAQGAIALIFTAGEEIPLVGYSQAMMARVNSYGRVYAPNLRRGYLALTAVFYDPETGLLSRVSGYTNAHHKGVAQLFHCNTLAHFKYDTPEKYNLVSHSTTKVLRGENDNGYSSLFVQHRLTDSLICRDREGSFKSFVNGYLLTGSTENNYKGIGLSEDPQVILSLDATHQANKDYERLNGHRYGSLKAKGIVNNSIAILDADRAEYVQNAKQALKDKDLSAYRAFQTFALSLAYRTYGPLRELSSDMVSAVVILMLLLLPFAFSMERLILGFTSIYSQIIGFICIFLATFGILYMVHPAFSLAEAPLVIFLAFVIILMSAIVIYIMMGKFKLEIKAMQGLVSRSHSAVKESSTAVASVLIGISGMRNRPLKTFLTAATIVLLTFTILVFASFDSQLGVVETYLGGGTGVDRVEVHRPSCMEIPPAIVHGIRENYKDDYEVFVRRASFVDPIGMKQSKAAPMENHALMALTGKFTKLSGVLGFEKGEIASNSDLKAIFESMIQTKSPHPPLMLPELVVSELGVKLGDEVIIRGKSFTFVAAFSSARLDALANMDNTKVVPPDFQATMEEEGSNPNVSADALDNLLDSLDVSSFLWLSADLCAVTTAEALEGLGDYVNHIGLYPKPGADLAEASRAIAQMFKGPVLAKDAEGARQFFFTSSIQGSGLTEVLVPLLLGGLIIFSSLMGSIVDREKEIFTFSALGLAPPDVATLFFAESAVYSVIGGVGGYLFSQLAAAFLGMLAHYGIFYPPEMNFSSLSSIYTILIVMGLVMISTIIPAIKAGRSANPGVARKWKMPEPKDNVMRFVFPFTVSQTDITGVLSFISEHFKSHSDASLGSFATEEVEIFEETREDMASGSSMGISMNMALAPFDLGIFQKFTLSSEDSDIPGIMEVVIELDKTSGASGAWVRSNRLFIDDLRNQFLLWRSLPVESVEHYCSMTQEYLKEAAVHG